MSLLFLMTATDPILVASAGELIAPSGFRCPRRDSPLSSMRCLHAQFLKSEKRWPKHFSSTPEACKAQLVFVEAQHVAVQAEKLLQTSARCRVICETLLNRKIPDVIEEAANLFAMQNSLPSLGESPARSSARLPR